MRRFFGSLLRVLVLFVVFMASLLTAMRFAIHGRQTTIPKLVGLTSGQAERMLADHGLVLDEGDRFFSSDVPPGRVMSQVPAPGMQVRRGWHVRVAESMGPQRVVIPDLLRRKRAGRGNQYPPPRARAGKHCSRYDSGCSRRPDRGPESAAERSERLGSEDQRANGSAGRTQLLRHA